MAAPCLSVLLKPLLLLLLLLFRSWWQRWRGASQPSCSPRVLKMQHARHLHDRSGYGPPALCCQRACSSSGLQGWQQQKHQWVGQQQMAAAMLVGEGLFRMVVMAVAGGRLVYMMGGVTSSGSGCRTVGKGFGLS